MTEIATALRYLALAVILHGCMGIGGTKVIIMPERAQAEGVAK